MRVAYDNLGASRKYIASAYWAFTTLTTVGYGDIAAVSRTERVFSIATMMVGVTWYAYVVSSISSIMASFDKRATYVRKKRDQINDFIRVAMLPKQLAIRVRNYMDATFVDPHAVTHEEDTEEVLRELSISLRTEVILWMNKALIRQIGFFDGQPDSFVATTCTLLQLLLADKSDTIVDEGSPSTEMFFLTKGRVIVKRKQVVLKILEAGVFFGEMGCMTGGRRFASVIAAMRCEMYTLLSSDLMRLSLEFPHVLEEMKRVSVKRMQGQKFRNRRMRRSSLIDQTNDMLKKLDGASVRCSNAVGVGVNAVFVVISCVVPIMCVSLQVRSLKTASRPTNAPGIPMEQRASYLATNSGESPRVFLFSILTVRSPRFPGS